MWGISPACLRDSGWPPCWRKARWRPPSPPPCCCPPPACPRQAGRGGRDPRPCSVGMQTPPPPPHPLDSAKRRRPLLRPDWRRRSDWRGRVALHHPAGSNSKFRGAGRETGESRLPPDTLLGAKAKSDPAQVYQGSEGSDRRKTAETGWAVQVISPPPPAPLQLLHNPQCPVLIRARV